MHSPTNAIDRSRSVLTIRKSEAISNTEFEIFALGFPSVLAKSAEVSRIVIRSKTIAYENRTKSAQSGGLETNGRRERILGLSQRPAVQRFVREARGYWASMRAQKSAETVARDRTGGGRDRQDSSRRGPKRSD